MRAQQIIATSGSAIKLHLTAKHRDKKEKKKKDFTDAADPLLKT